MTDLVKHYRQLVGIAASWALKGLAGWSDDSHRDLLARHGAAKVEGRVSASTLNLVQLGAVLDDYERRGWKREKGFRPAKGQAAKKVLPQIGLIVKLWGRLGMAGKVESATRPALLAWCGRQVGRAVKDLDSLSATELQALVEALKGWLGR